MKTDNELIAEFMGYERSIEPWDEGEHAYTIKLPDAYNKLVISSNMRFATSWDWLMPVVEKIMFFAYVKIDNGQCMISVNGTLVSGAVNGSNIENTYRAVVEFIKWHNTQNPTN